MTTPATERHPLRPFLPQGARLLMLGSFPPPRTRWSMDFFYPNYINDMWRVMGLVFYADKNYFVDEARRTFRLDLLIPFLEHRGIALYDTATAVRRLKDNASDKFLEITERTNIAALIHAMPCLQALCTTGQRATETLIASLADHGVEVQTPPVGGFAPFTFAEQEMRFYRMPSTSRAYPLAIEKKAAHYAAMFRAVGIV